MEGPPTSIIEPLESRIAPAFGAVFSLGNLDGSNGIQINGVAANDGAYRISGAGDFNGDGFDDVIIGAFGAAPNGVAGAGACYLVFGRSGGFAAAELDLSALDGTNGFRINGEAANDHLFSAATAGDFNGDGIEDVMVSAYAADPNGTRSGATYVLFGRTGSFGAEFNLSTLDGTNGFQLSGQSSGDDLGRELRSAGDVNGDGFDDIVLSAFFAFVGGVRAGSAFVVFGKAGGFPAEFSTATLDGTNGFRIDGTAQYDRLGYDVSGAGDVNGDGFDDVIVGANGADFNGSQSGAAYVVFGRASGFAPTIAVSSLNGTNGFRLNGQAAGDEAGESVASIGDINGDGLDDLVVSAPYNDPAGTFDGGGNYVLFGKLTPFPAVLNLSTLDGVIGFKVNGLEGRSGESVDGAGDVNGDGMNDLLIGAYRAGPGGVAGAGASYIVYGKTGSFGATLSVAALDGTNGFRIDGEGVQENSGSPVHRAGDVNGDGVGDFVIGAFGADPHGSQSGASYVVFGQGFTLGIADVALLEGDAGIRAATFAVNLSSSSTLPVSVHASVVAGTATAGMDFTPIADQLISFAPGETSKMVTVDVFGDTAVETNETFTVVLSNPTNALIVKGTGMGAIVNDDNALSGTGTVFFTEPDGDHLAIKVSKGMLGLNDFEFAAVPGGALIKSIHLAGHSTLSGTNLTVSSDGAGNGQATIGQVDAAGLNLGKVKIAGDVSSIIAGSGSGDAPAIKNITIGSLGMGQGNFVGQVAASDIAGLIAKFKVKGDVTNTTVNVGVASGSSVGLLQVAGQVLGSTFNIGGLIKTVKVSDKIQGSTFKIGKNIGQLIVLHDIDSSVVKTGAAVNALKVGGSIIDSEIRAMGVLLPKNATKARAIGSLTVGGNVTGSQILAGYDTDGNAANGDAGIGKVTIKGNFATSSIVAGIEDVTHDGFGQNDAMIAGGNAVLATIASITIKGTASGSTGAGDFFGITAELVSKATINGVALAVTTGKDTLNLDTTNGDFRLVEL